MRTIIACKGHDRVVVNAKRLEQRHHVADMAIHARDHARKGRHRIGHHGARIFSNDMLELRKLFAERGMIILGHMHGCMRNRIRQKSEKGLVLVVANKLECLLGDKVGRVGFTIHGHLLIVAPEMCRIK